MNVIKKKGSFFFGIGKSLSKKEIKIQGSLNLGKWNEDRGIFERYFDYFQSQCKKHKYPASLESILSASFRWFSIIEEHIDEQIVVKKRDDGSYLFQESWGAMKTSDITKERYDITDCSILNREYKNIEIDENFSVRPCSFFMLDTRNGIWKTFAVLSADRKNLYLGISDSPPPYSLV